MKAEAAFVVALAGKMVVDAARCGSSSSPCAAEFGALVLRVHHCALRSHPQAKHPLHHFRKHRVHIVDAELHEHPHQGHLIGKHVGLLRLTSVDSRQLTCAYIRCRTKRKCWLEPEAQALW